MNPPATDTPGEQRSRANPAEWIPVRRHGSRGRTVVVLHGGPGAPGSAAGLARRLANDFAVLEPLQRRSGRVPLTVARHVEDLAAVAPARAVLVGWSWGAMLALSFAARHPQRVSDLVLVGCGTYDDASRALYRQALDRRLGEAGRRKLKSLRARLAAEPDRTKRDRIFGDIGAACARAGWYDPVEDQNGATGDLPTDEAGNVETWRDVLRLQREGVEPQAFADVRARVLMVHGDHDPHPGPPTRDVLRRFIPHLEYVELPHCGHEPWRERHARDPFVEVVREWVSAGVGRR